MSINHVTSQQLRTWIVGPTMAVIYNSVTTSFYFHFEYIYYILNILTDILEPIEAAAVSHTHPHYSV